MKKLLCLVLSLLMLLSAVPALAEDAEPIDAPAETVGEANLSGETEAETLRSAEGTSDAGSDDVAYNGVFWRLNQMLKQFPAGKYWNHYVSYPGDEVVTTGTDTDQYMDCLTDNPCTTHNGQASQGYYDCNCFDGAIQCYGFANRIFYGVFGQRCKSELPIRTDIKNIRPGDHVRFKEWGDKGHSAIVWSRDGDTLTLYECNYTYTDHCVIAHGREVNLYNSGIVGFYQATNWDEVQQSHYEGMPSGYCGKNGNNIFWAFNPRNGLMSFYGYGEMSYISEGYKIQWRDYSDQIYRVKFDDRITSICNYAFRDCTNLSEVQLPSQLTNIGKLAFDSCAGIHEIIFPSGLSFIGESAFSKCTGLTELFLPCSISTYKYAFSGCTGLRTVAFLEDMLDSVQVRDLSDGMFSDCANLSKVILPRNIKRINNYVFSGCKSLESIDVSDCVDGFGTSAFGGSGITSFVIPDGVTNLSSWLFSRTANLQYIVIPESVTKISEATFWESGITDVYYAGSREQWSQVEILHTWNNYLPDYYGYSKPSFNWPLLVANMHYNSTGPQENEDTPEKAVTYNGYTAKFGPRTLSINSTAGMNNRHMAILCAMLSDASYSSQGECAAEIYRQMFDNLTADDLQFDYENDAFASSFALGEMVIDGQETNVLVITVKGTGGSSFNPDEFFADIWGETIDLNGYQTYRKIVDFRDLIMTRLNAFLQKHSEIDQKPLKIIITGHSLGGAAANLLGEMFTRNTGYGANSWWAPLALQSDIYCYAFAPIDAMGHSQNGYRSFPIYQGYSNIHNIVNVYDQVVVYSNLLRTRGCSGLGKYGHIDWFAKDCRDNIFNLIENHQMKNYLDAVAHSYVKEQGESYVRASSRCPVYVEVYDGDTLVCRISENEVSEAVSGIGCFVVGEEKYVVYPDNMKYSIRIVATDSGTMEFSVEQMSAKRYEVKNYSNVALTSGKQFGCEAGSTVEVEDIQLFVMGEDGKPTHEVQEDGREQAFPSDIMSTAANFMGKMLVNYYIVMNEEALADKDAYVEIKLNDDVKKVLVRDADTDEKNGVLRHKFEMEVPSECMRDDIVLKLHAGNGSLLPLTYKQETDVTEGFVYHMVDYLRGRQQNSTSEAMRRLAYTAEWYGTASQLYFNHHVNQLTEAEIAAMNEALNDASIMTGLANYAPIEGGTLPNGITKRSNTVVFESDNTLRTYFYTANPGAYTFTMDDAEIHLNEWEAGKYNYDIPNIPGNELAKWHKVTATDGTNTYTYKTSALGYCYGRAANSTNVDMQNLAKTLYLYGKAAMAYFNVPDQPAPADTPALPDSPQTPGAPQGSDIQLPIVP